MSRERKKGSKKKIVSFITVTDLEKAVITESLQNDASIGDVEPINADVLVNLGTQFRGVPPTEISKDVLMQEKED